MFSTSGSIPPRELAIAMEPGRMVTFHSRQATRNSGIKDTVVGLLQNLSTMTSFLTHTLTY